MPSVLESLSQMVTPEMAGQAARMLGVDEKTVQQGMATAGPLLQQLLADKSSTPEGAQQVYDTVTKADAAGGLESILGSLGQATSGGAGAPGGAGAAGGLAGMLGSLAGAGGGGQGLIDQLLGPQARQAVSDLVKKQTGMDIGPVLTLAAPLLAGALGKLVKEQNLDASGLAGLLQTQSKEYAGQHPEMQGLLNEAVQVSRQAGGTPPGAPQTAAAGVTGMAAAAAPPMAGSTEAAAPPPMAGATEAAAPPPMAGATGMAAPPMAGSAPAGALSADDLATLADGPVLAGGLVMAASPSGGAGAVQEVAAFAAAVSEAAQGAAPGTLLGQLAESLHALARRVQTDGLPGTPGGANAAEALRSTAALADSRASAEDAGAYKAMLLDVADRVARAAKEGGFLGIGGRQVSDSEAEALETIKAALQGGTQASGETAGMR